MTDVNPPPIPRIPPEWVGNQNIRAYQEAINRIIFQLWIKVGAGSGLETVIEESGDSYYLQAQINKLIKRHVDIPEISILQAQIKQLRKEIDDLKAEMPPTFPVNYLKRRLDDIEAQL